MRKSWKIPYISNQFLVKDYFFSDKGLNKVNCRNSYLPYFFINKNFSIYNGSKFISKLIKPDMIGFKSGVFSITKVLGNSKKKKKK